MHLSQFYILDNWQALLSILLLTEQTLSSPTFIDMMCPEGFLVVRQVAEEVMIGATTIHKWCIKLEFEQVPVLVDLKVAKLPLKWYQVIIG